MSSPEDGGGGAGAPSELATTAGADPSGNDANREQQPRALRRLIRCAAYSALAGAAVALVSHAALQLAMSQMGPPPLQTVAHLLPTAGYADAAPKDDLAPVALSPDQVDARYLRMLFAFEDRRFYSHAGVDPFGIARAARDLVLKQRIVTGGSTLTMQVARLLDNQYKRTPSVKLRQIVRALQLEQQLTKKQILSLYLGLAPFGGRVKGVRAASLKYFGKEPQSLSIAEAALLVALPQAPEARRLDRDAEAARRARNFVLKTVTAAGVLTPEEAQRAQLEPVVAASPPLPPTPEMKPVLKPDTANVAGLFAGITIGLNLVAGPASAAPIEPPPHPNTWLRISRCCSRCGASCWRRFPRARRRTTATGFGCSTPRGPSRCGSPKRDGRRKRWRSSTSSTVLATGASMPPTSRCRRFPR